MGPFVILSLALAVIAAGMVGVAIARLRGEARSLKTAIVRTQEQLEPLREELRDETAVTAIEVDGLRDRGSSHS